LINLQAIQFADVQIQGSWYFSVAQMASQTLGKGSSMSLTNFLVIENRTGYLVPAHGRRSSSFQSTVLGRCLREVTEGILE